MRMWRAGKSLVENCARICIWEFIRDNKMNPKTMLSAGQVNIELATKTTLSKIEQVIKQTLYFTQSNTNFNGLRVWFSCSECGRRVGCLYVPPRYDKFLCRYCYNLAYSSQNRHRESIWESCHKFEQKQAKVKKKLQNKWLRTRTKERLSNQYLELEGKKGFLMYNFVSRKFGNIR